MRYACCIGIFTRRTVAALAGDLRSEMMQFVVMIVERNRLFREGLRRLFVDSPFHVQYEASAPMEVIANPDYPTPADLVLIDFDSGVEMAEQVAALRRIFPKVRIVVLADKVIPTALTASVDAGVDGYLVKDMSPEALLQSLRLAMVGEKVFPTDLVQLLVAERVKQKARVNGAFSHLSANLSEREVEILACLLNGFSNKVIANQLHISEGTVKVHLKGILRKINVRNRTQAAIWAINNGISNRQAAAAPRVPERIGEPRVLVESFAAK